MSQTMKLPVPVGSLESYIRAVSRFPILSPEQELGLARKFRAENDVDAARDLVLSHLRVVVKIATTKAQRKLFFNLRSMKPTLDPLTQSEIKGVAKQLKVKPEEVAEMEMRLAGQEIALEPATDDEES